MQRIIKLDERNKIISERRGSELQENEFFSEKGLVGEIMLSDRVFIKDIYCDDKDIKNKITELYSLCGNDIVNNFTSDAYQGIEKKYDFEIIDQMNMIGIMLTMIVESLIEEGVDIYKDVEYYATDEDCVLFTGQEFNKLLMDGFMHKFALIQKYKALKERSKNCTLKEELNNVKWKDD